MGRGKDAGILHMALQVPELGQSNAGNIDNIRRIRDGHFGIRSFKGRDEGHDKVQQVLIEGEQGDQLGRGGQRLVVGQAVFVCLRLFLVFGHVLAVQALDQVDINGDASFVAVAGPLRVLVPGQSDPRSCAVGGSAYHEAGFFVGLDVEMVVELFYALLLEPFLCVGKLADGAIDVELSRA